jgi:hypothetical protein
MSIYILYRKNKLENSKKNKIEKIFILNKKLEKHNNIE